MAEEKVQDILRFILDLIHTYQEHKGQELFSKIKSAAKSTPAKPKTCKNRTIDPFRGREEVTVAYQWPSVTHFYQAYSPIKGNVHFQDPMDWMELARPQGFLSVPEVMQFKNQERHYPRDFEDEKHTKLRLLLNFGHEKYGSDPAYLYTVATLLDLPEKLVVNYYYKIFKEVRESLAGTQPWELPRQQAQARLEELKRVFGPEATRTLTLDEIIQMETRPVGNRAFLLTQYFCQHCLTFFCADHINSDYQPVFYFQFDETEYSESRSDMFRDLKKSPAELDRLYKADPPPTALQTHVECPASRQEHCWKYRKEQAQMAPGSLDIDALSRKIPLAADVLDRLKNLLRVCINSGTNNPCFLEFVAGCRLSCLEVGALASRLLRDEFRQSPIPGDKSLSSSKKRKHKKSLLDRRKGLAGGLTMDRSQYPGVFEEFSFPAHPANLLLQKNRILIGDSGLCPGLGLFAGQNFQKEQLVCLYFGEILEEEETSNFRAKVNNLYSTSYVFSLSEGKQFSIDSLVYGNKSRFVNHNEGVFNNCIIELAEVNSMEYVVFKAKREIKYGEELFFDYGDSYTLTWKYIYKQMVHFLSKLAEKKKCMAKARSRITKIAL